MPADRAFTAGVDLVATRRRPPRGGPNRRARGSPSVWSSTITNGRARSDSHTTPTAPCSRAVDATVHDLQVRVVGVERRAGVDVGDGQGHVREAEVGCHHRSMHHYRVTCRVDRLHRRRLRGLRPDPHRHRATGRGGAHAQRRSRVPRRPRAARSRAAARARGRVVPAAVVPRGGGAGPARRGGLRRRRDRGDARGRPPDAYHRDHAPSARSRCAATTPSPVGPRCSSTACTTSARSRTGSATSPTASPPRS